jgi:hypothetical protein
VASAAYVINLPTASMPTFSPAPGNYVPIPAITLSTTTGSASIRYTTDGSTPTSASGTLYTGPISLPSGGTIKALAYAANYFDSAVTTSTYGVATAAPAFSPVAGSYATAQTITISTATAGATIRYTTNGTTPTSTTGTVYSGPISVNITQNIKAIAYKEAYADSEVVSASYAITSGPNVLTYQSQSAAYTVSSSDLLHGLTPVVVGTGSLYTGNSNWSNDGLQGATAANDGSFTGRASVGMGSSKTRTDTGNAGGLDIIWNFATPQDLTSIALFFSWGDTGRDNVPIVNIYASTSEYVLTNGPNPDGQFSTGAVDAGVAANGNFVLLATTVDTAPATGNNSKVTVIPTGTYLKTGVRSLYIQFGAAENGWVGLNEIDAFGVPSGPPASNYASWASANGVTGGANGDSDNDGIKNLVEYALADGAERGAFNATTKNLSFTKRGGIYGSDISYAIEESTNLTDWVVVAEPPVINNAGSISYTLSGGTKKFARLKVTQP